MKTKTGEETFYTRPYVLWAFLSISVVGVSLVALAQDLISGQLIGEALRVRGLAAGAGIALAYWLSVLVSWLAPITLSKNGLRSYTILGVYHSIEWKQISRVEGFSVLGIRYAKVYSQLGGAPIWLPAFLARPDRFFAQIRQQTVYSNEVEQALYGRGARGKERSVSLAGAH